VVIKLLDEQTAMGYAAMGSKKARAAPAQNCIVNDQEEKDIAQTQEKIQMKNHAHNTHKHKHERDIRTLHIDI
jgi:hypothetical protein